MAQLSERLPPPPTLAGTDPKPWSKELVRTSRRTVRVPPDPESPSRWSGFWCRPAVRGRRRPRRRSRNRSVASWVVITAAARPRTRHPPLSGDAADLQDVDVDQIPVSPAHGVGWSRGRRGSRPGYRIARDHYRTWWQHRIRDTVRATSSKSAAIQSGAATSWPSLHRRTAQPEDGRSAVTPHLVGHLRAMGRPSNRIRHTRRWPH